MINSNKTTLPNNNTPLSNVQRTTHSRIVLESTTARKVRRTCIDSCTPAHTDFTNCHAAALMFAHTTLIRRRFFASRPTVATPRDAYRQLMLRVHPDFFADDEKSRAQNERALQLLNNLLSTTKSLDAVDRMQRGKLEASFEFVVREAPSVATVTYADEPTTAEVVVDDVVRDEFAKIQMRRVSSKFVSPQSRPAEGIITYKRRFQDACDALLKDLLRQIGVDLVSPTSSNQQQQQSSSPGASDSTATTDKNLNAEPFWIDTDMPVMKKDRDRQDVEIIRNQFLRYMLADWSLVVEKAADDGIDPSIEVHKYVPLLHESSIHSPLLSDAERDAALLVLKAHLIQLNFLQWHDLPIMLTLPAAARDANPDNARAEDSFLAEFGHGYVTIPTDFAKDVARTRRRIFESLPLVRRSKADLQRGSVIIDKLLRSVADGPLRFASLSIEAPLLSAVPVLRMFEQFGAEPPNWLLGADKTVLIKDMHISIVEAKPRNVDARSFVGAQRADTITVYGDSEAGVLSIDLRRWRLRVPHNVTLDELNEFFVTPRNRVLLYGVRSQIDVYTKRAEQFNRLCEVLRSTLGFTAIFIDADLNSSTGQFLPPELTKTASGTLLVPYSFGPLVSEHAAQNRVTLRIALRFVQVLINKRLAGLLELINDRSDIILVLSDRFAMSFLDEKSSLYRKKQKQIDKRTAEPQKQVVLRVPLSGFTIKKLREFLTTHRT
jgi:hypothetical protein